MPTRWTDDVTEAAAVLRSGGLVAIPTETVYGLAADAGNLSAVARVFEVKQRPRFDPLIVHVADRGRIAELTRAFPEYAQRLADRFWPGPLTLVVPKSPRVPDLVTAGLPTVAVRIPDHPLTRRLLRACRLPLAAPSANLFGQVSPTTAEHVARQLGGRIDLILDGGPCRVGIESTVVLAAEAQPAVLRPGGISVEELEAVIGPVRKAWREGGDHGPPPSPGMTPQHYAPGTRLILMDDLAAAPAGVQVAALAFRCVPSSGTYKSAEVLSRSGDLREAAAALFAALRRLDASGAELIVAERVPEEGLGIAINDRLQRAASG